MATFARYNVGDQELVPDLEGTVEKELPGSLLAVLEKDLEINILERSDETIEFEVIGIDASIANALRRIMIAEVPTMAIEHVYFRDNTSVIQDEVLAHRIGLVPIRADASQFDPFELEGEAMICIREGGLVLKIQKIA